MYRVVVVNGGWPDREQVDGEICSSTEKGGATADSGSVEDIANLAIEDAGINRKS